MEIKDILEIEKLVELGEHSNAQEFTESILLKKNSLEEIKLLTIKLLQIYKLQLKFKEVLFLIESWDKDHGFSDEDKEFALILVSTHIKISILSKSTNNIFYENLRSNESLWTLVKKEYSHLLKKLVSEDSKIKLIVTEDKSTVSVKAETSNEESLKIATQLSEDKLFLIIDPENAKNKILKLDVCNSLELNSKNNSPISNSILLNKTSKFTALDKINFEVVDNNSNLEVITIKEPLIIKKEKNWDQILKEEEIKDLKDKNYDCDPAMHFFKEIYKNSSDENRRAMMKSYQESGGKALSTNWKEASDRDYAKEFKDK